MPTTSSPSALVVATQLLQQRDLPAAGLAPGGPEIDHQRPSPHSEVNADCPCPSASDISASCSGIRRTDMLGRPAVRGGSPPRESASRRGGIPMPTGAGASTHDHAPRCAARNPLRPPSRYQRNREYQALATASRRSGPVQIGRVQSALQRTVARASRTPQPSCIRPPESCGAPRRRRRRTRSSAVRRCRSAAAMPDPAASLSVTLARSSTVLLSADCTAPSENV